MAEKPIVTTNSAPVLGKRVWYFLQGIDEPLGSSATLPAYQTEGTMTLGGEDVDEQTKQGRLIQKSSDEHSIELTQYFAPTDPALKMLEDAKLEGHSIKVWRVVVGDKGEVGEGELDSKLYPAYFGYGRPEEIEYSDGEGWTEVSYTLNIVGALKKGKFPLSDADLAMIEDVYEYENPGETTGDYDAKPEA